MTIKEHLVCIDVKLEGIGNQLTNHLSHHNKALLALIPVIGGLITALIIVLLRN